MAARGSYVHNSMVEFGGHPENVTFHAIFSENLWCQTKIFTGLRKTHTTLNQSHWRN